MDLVKANIHYHSDCEFFAGCENMLANLFNDTRLSQAYNITFSYRRTPRYIEGFTARVSQPPPSQTYPLLADDAVHLWCRSLPAPLSLAMRILQYICLVRYWILVWNVLVLVKAWNGRKIDILHVNNGGYPGASSCRAAVLAGRLCGIRKILMVVNNTAVTPRRSTQVIEIPLNFWISKCVTFFVTGSRHAALALADVLRVPSSKVLNFHNGIAPRPTFKGADETRARLGVSPGALLFGIVALLEERKGHRNLIQAMAILRDRIPAGTLPTLLVEGSGPDEKDLRSLVVQSGLSDNVRFIGHESNVFEFMLALDVLVLPSIRNEDFPNVILEAMSLGKAVIASKLAGVPEQIEDGVTGWLVAPNNPDDLASVMAQLVSQKGLIARAGNNAKVRFEKLFSANIAVSRYLALYHDIFGKRS